MNKQLAKFTKAERSGLVIWSLAILIISISGSYWSGQYLNDQNHALLEKYLHILDSISLSEQEPENNKMVLHPFNPDTISARQLKRMGIPQKLSERWVNFREYVGSYQTIEDIKKIYGMDSNMVETISPFLLFKKPAQNRNPESVVKSEHKGKKDESLDKEIPTHNSSLNKPPIDINHCEAEAFEELGFPPYVARRIVKYREKAGAFYAKEELLTIYGIDSLHFMKNKDLLKVDHQTLNKLDLNTATKEELMNLPGIGPSYAQRIIDFREGLGGFLHLSQLHEVYGIEKTLFEKLRLRVQINDKTIQRIKINSSPKDSLAKHPYIDWDQAQKIVNFRKHHYPIRSLKDMLSLDPEWVNKIEPYIDYGVRPES